MPWFVQLITDTVSFQTEFARFTDAEGLSVNIELGFTLNPAPYVPVDLDEFSANVSWKSVDFGYLSVPPITLSSDDVGLVIDARLTITDEHTFDLASWELLNSDSSSWHLGGNVPTIHAKALGLSVPFHNIRLDQEVSLVGLAGRVINISTFDFLLNEDNHVIIRADITMQNPAQIEIVPLGNLNFSLSSNGLFLGYAQTKDQNLTRGLNNFNCESIVDPSFVSQPIIQLAESFFEGTDTNITVTATENASSIELYAKMLSFAGHNFSMATTVPGVKSELVVAALSIITEEDINNTLHGQGVVIQTEVWLANPVSAEINVHAVNLSLYHGGIVVGQGIANVTSDGHPLNVIIPGHSIVKTPTVDVRVFLHNFKQDREVIESFYDEYTKGIACVGIEGSVAANVGDLQLPNLTYHTYIDSPLCSRLRPKICNQIVNKEIQSPCNTSIWPT